ncbi:nuclease EXOG, mitochondrial [Rana temporaria]|uniref:nuclease EXOG, mitochondrial n=1 Tax=Rana temporaria TaxID=8407 RepID=UPI001AACD294|nr:nuclease EXOG, mitochondrial [Rana temporaria]
MTGRLVYRLVSRRFVGGFVVGAAVSSASCLAALHLYDRRRAEPEPVKKSVLEEYGFPQSGNEVRQYVGHSLSYDQERKIPRWVIEHLTKEKTVGNADRKHCKFKPDPNIPAMFSASNEDYLKSGWSRGHMAPAGDAKYSKEAMTETFYLSNIVPQNYENNGGFWNRLEMYCRDLAERFDDVWVVSGPLTLPVQHEDGKKSVTYQVIGKDDVAVPTHLFKVILARKNQSAETLTEGAFIVPNIPISFDHQLPEFQVECEDLEKKSGLVFFPQVDKSKGVKNLCEVDTCRLIQLDEFKLYIAARRMKNAKNLQKVEKIMRELDEAKIQPDKYFIDLYEQKKKELSSNEPSVPREGRRG